MVRFSLIAVVSLSLGFVGFAATEPCPRCALILQSSGIGAARLGKVMPGCSGCTG